MLNYIKHCSEKKMYYLYVGNYAKVNPDLALLTINFLQRDCKDMDPMIRRLALRSLCSLRAENLVEYLIGPLGSGLKDNSSYVRMVVIIGVSKLYHIFAAVCIDADFPATLLNRINELSEWAQCLVLELVAKYVPSDSNDIFDIMNLLEDRLQHANGAVVLATIKVFMHLTLSMTDIHQQVYIKA